jgi:hypothetical protein
LLKDTRVIAPESADTDHRDRNQGFAFQELLYLKVAGTGNFEQP